MVARMSVSVVGSSAVSESSVSESSGIRIRSALPGRYRVWVAGLYRNEELKTALEAALAAPSSRRSAQINVTSGTLLLRTSVDERVENVVRELEGVLAHFAERHAIPLPELRRRGQKRPLHLALEGKPHRRRPSDRRGLSELANAGLDKLEKLARHATAPKSDAARPDAARAKRVLGDEAPGEEQVVHAWHTLDVGRVIEALGVESSAGLTPYEASGRLARFRHNALPQVKKRSGLAMFLDQFKELPVLLLAGSTVLSMLTGGVADGLVILGVIVINGVIGFVTENTAERTIASLTREDAPDVEVCRQGEWLRVPIEEIVPGDVLRLYPGALVPADARLLAAHDLSVDESALTGESVPVGKTTKVIGDPDLPLADRTNMIYRGTFVTGGSGTALVVATGRATQVGQLQQMVGEVERPET